MAFAPIPEYEGKAPYVFITYAQQDEKIAYSIAVKMYNEGFRLWSSAACGNPSNMRIAERLSNSEVAMVFLSRSYLKYASYKEFEPRAVMNSPKKKIVICLDDTPLGTDWNTVDFPAGIRYNPDIPQELWLRINSSDTLDKCRGAWPRNPLPLPFEENRTVNVSVDEDELSDELTSLNSVMSSFGAGLDDSEIRNITLFNRDADRFRTPVRQERSQEQEYYAIENLIDNSPMPAEEEQQQYDNMVGLIGSFMEKSHRTRKDEPQWEDAGKGPLPVPPVTSSYEPSYGDFHPVPKNEFGRVDLSKDLASNPVVITESSDINADMKPIVIDYGDDSEVPVYNMTRRSSRTAHVNPPSDSAPVLRPEPIQEPAPPAVTETTFEKVVDDRKLITSTEDNAADARLTYHLGALDIFDEGDDISDEMPAKQPESLLPEPADPTPARFTDNEIPQPALRFDKPAQPQPQPEPPKNRRSIVSVRTRVRRTEYESEMYEVNGRWIPGEIYHRLMPDAKYTMVRRISRPKQTTALSLPKPSPAPAPIYRSPRPELNTNSRLHGAVNTFFTPQRPALARTAAPQPAVQQPQAMPESVRSALRERHEARRTEAIRQLQSEEAESAAASAARSGYKNSAAAYEDENTPARKHKFSHEGGIKKSLMANMETPVDTTDLEDSHRQFGARAELASSSDESAPQPSEKKSDKKKEKQKEQERAAKKAAQKEAEKEKRREAQKKAAQKKAEEERKNKKKKQSKSSKEEESSAAKTPTRYHARMPQRLSRNGFSEVDDDNLIEMPSRNLPNINYDPEAYRDMNLSEILFGEGGDKKDAKKKKKK